MTTQLELYAAIDRVRLVRRGVPIADVYAAQFPNYRQCGFDRFLIAMHHLDQLDRDAREADTPCPDCVILETDVVAVSVQSGLVKVGLYCADAYFNCRTVADLRRWCAALGCEMPELKPCERPE